MKRSTERRARMMEWTFLLTPLAILAVLLLFRFVGCDSIVGIDELHGTDYPGTVAADHPVSYWRLHEEHSAEPSPGPTAPNTPVSGGTAKDETGANDGIYKAVIVQSLPQLPDSPSAPGSLMLEAAGLLGTAAGTGTSLSIDGGYVEVPFSSSLSLQSFTIEAMVFPEWDLSEMGLYRAVITLNMVGLTPGSNKAFGFGLFAGPNDPAAPSGPDVWQIWLADGTNFTQLKDPSRSLWTSRRPTMSLSRMTTQARSSTCTFMFRDSIW